MSWVATTTAAPASASSPSAAASASLCARSIPRVGSSSSTAARGRRRRAPPRARAAGARRRTGRAGWPAPRPSSPAAATPCGPGVLDGVLVDQVVARVLEQQRHLAGALDAPARGLDQALGQPQQRALAGAVAAHQRHALAGRSVEVEPAQHASGRPRSRTRRRAARAPARGGRRGAAGAAAGRGRAARAPAAPGRRPLAQPGARLLDRRGALGQPGQREQPRGRGGQHGHRTRRPRRGARAAARRRRSAPSTSATTRSAAGQAALQAVLGDHHGRAPVLVQAPQQPDQLVAGHRVELRGRLVEQQQRRAVDHRGGDRHALELAAGEGVGAPLEQVADARATSAVSSTARATAAAGSPRCSSGSSSSARTPPITTCVSGSWKTVPQHGGQLARAVLAHVEAADHASSPLASPPWKCGTSPQSARSSVDLPEPDTPASTVKVPGSSSSVDVAQRAGRRAPRGTRTRSARRGTSGSGTRHPQPRAAAEQRSARPSSTSAPPSAELRGAELATPASDRPPPRPRPRAAPAIASTAIASAAAPMRRSWRETGRAAARRAARERVAAHLERGGHVHGAVERARQRRARRPPGGRAAAGGSARRRPCAPASRASTGTSRVASEAVSAER